VTIKSQTTNIGKELEANKVILDEGIKDEEQWEQNVQGYM